MKAKILSLTIGLVIVISLAAAGGLSFLNLQEELQKEELMLSDYPEVFKNDTIIVIGENASQIETESAEAIATRVTEEYPGENKGILEILWNPWNEEKAILLVEGSDEWGVKAGRGMLTENEKIKELSGERTVTEFMKEPETNESWVIASDDELLGKYETSDRLFKTEESNDRIIYWHQRMIDDAIVEGDYINYQFDKNTKELIKKIIYWRDDLPEHVAQAITKKQAESIAGGGSATLYFLSTGPSIFPTKPTPKNPCWVVRSIDDGRMVITIIDAVDGEILGYGISPP